MKMTCNIQEVPQGLRLRLQSPSLTVGRETVAAEADGAGDTLRWTARAGAVTLTGEFRPSGPGPAVSLPLEQYHCHVGKTGIEFTLEAPELSESRYDLVLQISSLGHHTQGLIPVMRLNVPPALFE